MQSMRTACAAVELIGILVCANAPRLTAGSSSVIAVARALVFVGTSAGLALSRAWTAVTVRFQVIPLRTLDFGLFRSGLRSELGLNAFAKGSG